MRIVGIETEYGITLPGDPHANPVLLSAGLVEACRRWAGVHTTRWDYGAEDPLLDQRGIRRTRASATPGMLTDGAEFDEGAGAVTLRRRRGSWEDPAHLNAVLSNGCRFYVDHAHPEYSGPEVTNPHDAVVWDRAGDRIALAAASTYAEVEGTQVALYKNNVDGKGASYGTHENFLVDRGVDFADLARRLTPHLVTRQIFTGAGRVGLGQFGESHGFQISQRADYMEAEVGLETTLRRPIVNTRDEPHADRSKWRRLHVIIGDANCAEIPTFLKVGTTSLVLSAIEADDSRLDELVLLNPVGDVQRVSRDLTLRAQLALANGASASAVEIQRLLIEICRKYVSDDAGAVVLERWEAVVDRLAGNLFDAAREVEWVAKLQLLERMRTRHADASDSGEPMAWSAVPLAAADVKWSELGTGLAARLEETGALERISTPAEVDSAMAVAPHDTRAALRGGMIARRPELVDAAGWSTVVLDRDADHGNLEVVHLDDPARASHPLLDALIDG